MTEGIACIKAEAAYLQDFLASLRPEDWARPSAYAEWTVGDVVAHITQGARTWAASLRRAMAGDANPPAGEQTLRLGERGSEATAQRAIAFRQEIGEEALLQAFVEAHEHFHQVAQTLRAEDWDKPCYHRRGVMSVRDYMGVRLQELTLHGWDARTAFDPAATLSEPPLPLLLGLTQRWLSNTFRPVPALTAPVRYRFDITAPVPVYQDVVVSPDGFRLEPATDSKADVTFRCTTGDYILLIYGRLPLEQAMSTGRLAIAGDRAQARLFPTLFQGV